MRRVVRRLVGSMLVAGVGCAAGTPSAPTVVPDPSATANSTATPTSTPTSTATATATPTPTATEDAGGATSPEASGEPACGGADVDLAAVLANKRCRAHRDAPPTPASAATDVKVTLTPSATKVAPGGHVDLDLALVNTGAAAVPLYFSGDLTLSAEVADAKGTRVAPPAGNAPKNADPKCADASCRLPASHLLLPPGGKAHARVGWDAVKTAWPATGPTTCCTIHVDAVAKGPLAAGTYRVKVPLPYESTLGNPPDPEVVLRVGK